ncbi:MAG TPA: exodeoxyribonuclease V subunit alpha [Candidatus Competibacter sp.]|nr:exodeoxyribonuclease V subunit alpha [Candidatus Competibacter sp.]
MSTEHFDSNDPLPILYDLGLLTDLDLHFARFVNRLAGGELSESFPRPVAETLGARESLELAAALASHATGQGDICVNLRQWAWRWNAGATESTPFAPPPIGDWLEILRSSPVVGRPGERHPLILDRRGRLYLYRYWGYERQLADDLLQRASADPDEVDEAQLRADLDRLFPHPPQLIGPDWQKVAAAVAALKRICVISGGPGTGKTSTVLRILALLSGQAGGRPLRVALAAPTGKAAARLQESIRAAKPGLGLEPQQAVQIPEEASTLHRLLGGRPDSVYFRHDRDNPLPLDVLVVDEVSMVGLALMAKTVDALPPEARLILLGDKDQLASVEAGSVLGEMCAGAGRFSPAFQARLARLTGEALPGGREAISPLVDAIVLLRHSFRFGATSGIGALARAVNKGRSAAAMALLADAEFRDIDWQRLADPADLAGRLAEPVTAGFASYLRAARERAEPAAVFGEFGRFRVLAALRGGPFGVEALNRLCETALHGRGLIDERQAWYVGRPVMIVRNDYNLRLFNGDIGITLADPDEPERVKVFFLGSDGTLRSFAPARLPEHETVYAMTVHKSQGSEFERILVVTPNEPSPVLSRELVYTALTRAKQHASFYGVPEVFAAAVERRLRRSSGLRDRLWVEPRARGNPQPQF